MIFHYLEKLLTWHNKRLEKVKHKTIGLINFSMLDDYSVDINIDLPDMSNATPAETAMLAERYAEFLLSINQGFHKNNIVNILQSKIDQNNNQQYLFIDNIITFWGLLYEQYKKNKKNYIQYNQPVVRPSQVFKI
jgi:hypothetical protein